MSRTGAFLAAVSGSLLLVALSGGSRAAAPDDGRCRSCHVMARPDGPSPEGPAVDGGQFARSPHAKGGCRSCHPGLDPKTHPASPAAPDAEVTVPCRDCHDDQQLSARPVHGLLLRNRKSQDCTECHLPHRMQFVADWKPAVPVSMYCLTCHQRQLTVALGGERLAVLTINRVARGERIHLDHACPDCHDEYSKLDHPLASTAERQARRLKLAAACRGCHEEQARLFAGGLHARMTELGNPAAPDCTDCHGFHAVESVEAYRVLTGEPCRRCHEEVFREFQGSRHAGVEIEGHLLTPPCSSCHRVHDLEYGSAPAELNAACLSCHRDAAARHRAWLPAATTHFEVVACPACHAPAPSGAVAVSVVDTLTGKPVPSATLRQQLGRAYGALAARAGGEAADLEAWSGMIWEMNRREPGRKRYVLRLQAPEGRAAHRLGGRAEACRQCERCHVQCLETVERSFPTLR